MYLFFPFFCSQDPQKKIVGLFYVSCVEKERRLFFSLLTDLSVGAFQRS